MRVEYFIPQALTELEPFIPAIERLLKSWPHINTSPDYIRSKLGNVGIAHSEGKLLLLYEGYESKGSVELHGLVNPRLRETPKGKQIAQEIVAQLFASVLLRGKIVVIKIPVLPAQEDKDVIKNVKAVRVMAGRYGFNHINDEYICEQRHRHTRDKCNYLQVYRLGESKRVRK